MGLIQNKVTVSQPVSHIVVENAGGLRGETGSQGPEGPVGAPGEAATVSVGTTTTLPAGSSATVTNTGTTSDAVFNFGIPKGDKGDKGDAGAGLVITGSVATYADLPNDLGPEDAGKAYFVEADGKLYVWSGTQFPAEGEGSQFEGPQGPQGEQGPAGADGADGADGAAATIAVGTTTTLPAGSSATVTNSGTSSAAVFDFSIPQGATGATGATGPANTLSIGTVESGETAAATITGTAPNQTLNLTLPQGDPGPAPDLYRERTGTTISITDAGVSLKKLNKISGDTAQASGVTPDTPQAVHTVTGTQTVTIDNGNGQSSSYNIDLASKNLFDKDHAIVINAFVNGTSGLLATPTNNQKSVVVSVQPSTTYTISGVERSTSNYGMFDDATLTIGTSTATAKGNINNGTITFTTGANTKWFVFLLGGGTETYGYNNVQVETGSTATAYTSFWQIELCKIMLSASVTAQDYIYNNNGDWYLHKETAKVVYNSGTGWSRNAQLTTVNRFRLSVGSTYRNGTDPGQMYSNLLTVESTYSGDYEHIYKYGDYLYAFFNNSRVADATALGTYLAANPLICYLALTTPTDTQITDATLIAQLNALNSAATYEGETHITNTANLSNLTGSLDLEYWTWFHFIAETDTIADGAITVPKINSLQDLADALRPYLQ